MSVLALLAAQHEVRSVTPAGRYRRLRPVARVLVGRQLGPKNKPTSAEKAENSRRRDEALRDGSSFYMAPWRCRSGHPALRRAATGTCFECTEAKTSVGSAKAAMAARSVAIELGQDTYVSFVPCRKGHTGLRYVSSYGCVLCSESRRSELKEAKKGYDRAYRVDNADRLGEQKRRWRAENADLVRAVKRSYKSRRRSQVEGADSGAIWAWERSALKVCAYCGEGCARGYHVDHYIPLSKGGAHRPDNLRIACAECNLRKSNLWPEQFMQRLPELLKLRYDPDFMERTARTAPGRPDLAPLG